jgi:hypothetical protein
MPVENGSFYNPTEYGFDKPFDYYSRYAELEREPSDW